MLDAGAPQALGLPLLGLGSVALAASLFTGGRRAVRTRYRPDPWRLAEWIVGLSGLVAVGGMIVAARLPDGSLALNPPAYPLAWPTLPLVAVAGIAVALLPSVAAPRPPAYVTPPVVESLAPDLPDAPVADVLGAAADGPGSAIEPGSAVGSGVGSGLVA